MPLGRGLRFLDDLPELEPFRGANWDGKGKKEEVSGMRFQRPKVGKQVIRVDRIRAVGKATDVEIDAMATTLSEKGLPEPIEVFWNLYDWPAGFVDYKGSPAFQPALRALGHCFIEANVQIDPASGLNVEPKEYPLEVVHEKG